MRSRPPSRRGRAGRWYARRQARSPLVINKPVSVPQQRVVGAKQYSVEGGAKRNSVYKVVCTRMVRRAAQRYAASEMRRKSPCQRKVPAAVVAGVFANMLRVSVGIKRLR